MDKLKIVPYKATYKSEFEVLNRLWIEKYFVMEDEDLNTLQNPESYVIDKGGEIFFAILEENVVGTAAMMTVWAVLQARLRSEVDAQNMTAQMQDKVFRAASDTLRLLHNDMPYDIVDCVMLSMPRINEPWGNAQCCPLARQCCRLTRAMASRVSGRP